MSRTTVTGNSRPGLSMFEFVHEQPGIRKNGVTAKQVRSHVTRRQHRQKRELNRRAIALLNSEASTPTPEPVINVDCGSRCAGSLKPVLQSHFSNESIQHGSLVTSTHIEEIPRRSMPSSVEYSDLDDTSKGTTPETWLCPSDGLAKAFSQGQMSYRTTLLQDTENVVGTSLNILRLDLSSVMVGHFNATLLAQPSEADIETLRVCTCPLLEHSQKTSEANTASKVYCPSLSSTDSCTRTQHCFRWPYFWVSATISTFQEGVWKAVIWSVWSTWRITS